MSSWSSQRVQLVGVLPKMVGFFRLNHPILIGSSMKYTHPFWGTTIFGNKHFVEPAYGWG